MITNLRCKFKFSRKGLLFVLVALSVPVILALTILNVGIYINFSSSMTPGVWIKIPVPVVQNAREYVVIVKQDGIPSATKYAGKYDLLKRILAISGDNISYDGNNLIVNNIVIANSKIYERDGRGDFLPRVSFPLIVPRGTVWLFSDDEKGYDSRYFGPVPLENIKSGVRLIWRFNS